VRGLRNVAAVVGALDVAARESPFAKHLAGRRGPWNFAGPDKTVPRLQRAGFIEVEAGLHNELVYPDNPREYLGTMILGAHLDCLPPELRDALVERVVSELPEPLAVEYVRLTMSARRPD
jgi:trans-aconitate 2-methyltransferase